MFGIIKLPEGDCIELLAGLLSRAWLRILGYTQISETPSVCHVNSTSEK